MLLAIEHTWATGLQSGGNCSRWDGKDPPGKSTVSYRGNQDGCK